MKEAQKTLGNPFKFNPHKLKKKEMVWLMTHKCKHGHTYMEHPACYYLEQPQDSPVQEKIGFLDIESTNLKASFGYVISWCIKEYQGKLYEDVISPKDIQREARTKLDGEIVIDKRILKNFYDTVTKFDKIFVYWGKNRRHDIPFLRHRCLKTGIPFPFYGEIILIDMYDWTKSFLSLHSYKLEVVCKEFDIPAKGHPLTGQIWIKANAGNKKALQYILEHNREDVICLEPLYEMLEPFARRQRTSI